jgi:hypothetical protein
MLLCTLFTRTHLQREERLDVPSIVLPETRSEVLLGHLHRFVHVDLDRKRPFD